MARRGRLALRQISEPVTVDALSDLDDEGDGLLPANDQPTFNLLPTLNVQSVTAPPPENGHRADDVEMSSTQEFPADDTKTLVPPHNDGTRESDVKRQRVSERVDKNGVSATVKLTKRKPENIGTMPQVFKLYQRGLLPSHMLRMHFIRRKVAQTVTLDL
ncbi:hypothetical protein P43SY_006624 [Pythium insidiosum]|uniref:Uncharacterized protein n=1 Tax=Pythium insidiosum TaxID=114742 RepID=A0AAD5LK88_PYTIN|nr:hypothetical protein P43SY_006624 [Pythium insidiosum]